MAEYEGLKWKIIEKFKPESDIVAEDLKMVGGSRLPLIDILKKHNT